MAGFLVLTPYIGSPESIRVSIIMPSAFEDHQTVQHLQLFQSTLILSTELQEPQAVALESELHQITSSIISRNDFILYPRSLGY